MLTIDSNHLSTTFFISAISITACDPDS